MLQVLVGDCALGKPEMVCPPPKDPSKPRENLYDTCVDDVGNPSVFVTFDPQQSYPEYLVEY